jgi:hypothetical protein
MDGCLSPWLTEVARKFEGRHRAAPSRQKHLLLTMSWLAGCAVSHDLVLYGHNRSILLADTTRTTAMGAWFE